MLCKKVKSFIESQNVKFDEKTSSGHNNKMGAKSEDLQHTNLSVCEFKKRWEIYGLICKKLGLPIML